jgi:hypothetical protein
MKQYIIFLTAFVLYIQHSDAQEQLPNFSVYKVGGGRVVLSWTHNYANVKQISLQRSYDSLNFFKTIATMPDPTIQQNGFADSKPPTDSMFYRIYVLLGHGQYFVTKSKRPSIDSVGLADAYSTKEVTQNANFLPSGFTASKYIYTSEDRYVRIELPIDSKKYNIKFFSETSQPLFELNIIKERKFKLDRSYFYKAGYINYEIYADGKLFEKYKLYLPKEF